MVKATNLPRLIEGVFTGRKMPSVKAGFELW